MYESVSGKRVTFCTTAHLLKSRIDLEKEHLWVVYPCTRDRSEKSSDSSSNPPSTTQESTSKTEAPASPPELSEDLKADSEPSLHVQIAGSWEPETLHLVAPTPTLEQKPDYFSIQGEVVYQNVEAGWVMVKIIQFSRRKPDEKPPYFNLKLLGFLPDRPVKNFFYLHVEREGTNLVIQDGQRIAYLGKKNPKGKPNKGKPTKGNPIKRTDAVQQPVKAVASPKEPPKLKKKQPASNS